MPGEKLKTSSLSGSPSTAIIKPLFRHETNGVAFTLVVDDFGVKFKDPAAADDLVRCLQLYYTLTIKKNATKFLGLTIAVDPIAREVRLSAPSVILKLQRFAQDSTAVARSPAIYLSPRLELPLRLSTIPTPFLCLLLTNITAYRCSAAFYYIIASPSTQLAYLLSPLSNPLSLMPLNSRNRPPTDCSLTFAITLKKYLY